MAESGAAPPVLLPGIVAAAVRHGDAGRDCADLCACDGDALYIFADVHVRLFVYRRSGLARRERTGRARLATYCLARVCKRRFPDHAVLFLDAGLRRCCAAAMRMLG